MRKLTLLFLLLAFTASSFAKKVEMDEARRIAGQVYYDKLITYDSQISPAGVIISETFTMKEEGVDMLYIFNFESYGFLVLAADDAMFPVLGYTFDHPYNPEYMPDNFTGWINGYVENVKYLKINGIEASGEIEGEWDYWRNYSHFSPREGGKDVEPLMTCTWNQDWPYNYYCPLDPNGPGGHVYVGCVATAMSMIMYYWRYPEQGTGSHSYSSPYGQLTVNFGATTYDWDGMVDDVPSGKINLPVALIGYHAAVSVDMQFGPNGSGAYSDDVPYALKTYFGYAPYVIYTQKTNGITWETWKGWVRGQLDDACPVYYSGTEPGGGGHAFVVDGYHMADEMFHFNFGWSGMGNGWFLINNAGGFTNFQGMVRNIYPADASYPYFCQGQTVLGNLTGTIEDGSGPQENYQDNANCQWLIDPQSGNDSVKNITLSFISMDTQSNEDVITVYDGPTTSDPVLGAYSGNTTGSPVTSTGNKMLVVFQTNGSVTASGWKALYTTTQPQWCSGLTTLTEPSGSFDDGSGSFNYNISSNCMWKIQPQWATDITLTFTSFLTEEDRDIVKIYDAGNNQLLAEYSGLYNGGVMPDPVTAPSGKLFITFQTDGIINYDGWTAEWAIGNTGASGQTIQEGNLTVFPIPANDRITIYKTVEGSDELEIRIINTTGATVYLENTGPVSSNYVNTITTQDWNPGIYFLRVKGLSQTENRKIIVR
ncbi:MAG: C10 family peptidase [Bacteroidales bacterium]|nr:C10 family peptidase [Bacteroidales bacterium]